MKGPLSEETEASDDVDGGWDSVTLDPERFEPELDEEDTYVKYPDSWQCVLVFILSCTLKIPGLVGAGYVTLHHK